MKARSRVEAWRLHGGRQIQGANSASSSSPAAVPFPSQKLFTQEACCTEWCSTEWWHRAGRAVSGWPKLFTQEACCPMPSSSQLSRAASKAAFPAGLPPGWRRIDTPTAAGRLIPCYHGPSDVQARSRVEAWRRHGATLLHGARSSSSPPVVVPGPSGAGQRGAAGKKPTSCGGPEQEPPVASSSGSGQARPLPADRGSSRRSVLRRTALHRWWEFHAKRVLRRMALHRLANTSREA